MRLRTKSIITLVALLLLGITEAWAQKAVTVIIQQNGTQVTVSSDGNGGMTSSTGTIKVLEPAQDGTVTLTATPATGFYITAEQISVTRTVDGSKAQTREPSIDNTPLTLTALTPNDDPSGETSYSFTMDMAETAEYDYEITANFLSQTDLSNAVITLEGTTFTYTGEPIEPAVTSVKVGETVIDPSNYTVSWHDNIEPGAATDQRAPFADITGQLTCTGYATKTFTIEKIKTGLTFAAETAQATMGAEFEVPKLTVTPETLEGVKYTSSDANVATVNETTGAVTLVGAGETTITATFAATDYNEAATASYTLTVSRGQGQGYGLWINDIQVTEDNYFDVLGNKTDSKSGTIVFNPEKNTLVMTNDVSNVEIESRLESLTLHINDVNKVKSIRFNNLGDATKTGKLTITTNGNFPGKVIITNDTGVSAISGFSELTLEQDLLFVEPELVELKNGELYQYDFKKVDPTDPESKLIKDDATEAICNAVTIGVIITPLTQNVTVLLSKGDDFIVKDANGNPVTDTNGNPVPASLKNFALSKDILLTIWTEVDEQNSQAGQEVDAGFDDSDGKPGITMVNTMTDAQVQKVAKDVLKNIIMPGGTSFAYEFNGVTFIVPAGSGSIIIDQETDPGYEYHLAPIGLNETYNLVIGGAKIEKYELLGGNRVRLTIDYSNLPTQTYYLLYLTQEASSGTRGGTRLGKRDKAHGKLYSVGVRPRSITDVNPPSEASGGVIDEEEDPEGVIDNPTPPTPPTGIQTVASESSVNSNKWFTADGRQLESKPTKPGFYIRNGKKVVIK